MRCSRNAKRTADSPSADATMPATGKGLPRTGRPVRREGLQARAQAALEAGEERCSAVALQEPRPERPPRCSVHHARTECAGVVELQHQARNTLQKTFVWRVAEGNDMKPGLASQFRQKICQDEDPLFTASQCE